MWSPLWRDILSRPSTRHTGIGLTPRERACMFAASGANPLHTLLRVAGLAEIREWEMRLAGSTRA